METDATRGADAAPSGVIIHAPRADQLVRLSKSERRAGVAGDGATAEGSAVR